ncbi:hypothetical protein JYU34_015390 [Plutella xylostella]|uniref:Retrovirus-related Pol polyprotein from transposon TNT 1-94 n=1 Tax=Plutella xylostella TaxID=51655 RepID=A0ABQ7Q724_PLUXY|nr:hypothetical protein JYU34_015390 [Plutella xylostella]
MIMAIEHSGIAISSDVIKTKLLDMSSEVGSVGSSGPETSAFLSKRWQQKKKSSAKVGSTDTTNKMASTSNGIKTIKCFKCKQIGHYMNQCTKQVSNAFSAVFLNGSFNTDDWYIDSGASSHLIASQNRMRNISYENEIKEIITANKQKMQVVCTGDVPISTIVNNVEHSNIICDALCVPGITTNLLSVSRLIQKGNKVLFKNNLCEIRNPQNVLVGIAELVNGVYKLITKTESVSLTAASGTSTSMVWHRRLGHINSKDLNIMKDGAVKGISYPGTAEISMSNCSVCCEGKQARLPFPQSSTRSEMVLEIVHADVCGPMEQASIGMSKYFLLFVDDFSRMSFVYFLKSKSEVFKYFKEFKSLVEKQTGKEIKILRTDNGGEFCSKELNDFLKDAGITHQLTNPYTPEQNGVCERLNRTIVEKARCLLFDAKLQKKLWAEAVSTAVYLRNRSPVSGHQKTPYELWTGSKPDLSHIRVFGSTVMAHIPKQRRLKWDRKAAKYILVGYSENIKGYKLYQPESNSFTTSRDIRVLNEGVETDAVIAVTDEREPEHEETESSNNDGNNSQSVVPSTSSDSEDSFHEPLNEEIQKVEDLPAKRVRRKPDYYGFSNLCTENVTSHDEMTLQEALQGPERAQWKQAVEEELQAFESNDAWEIVDVPSDRSIVKCKWVLNKKVDIDNKVRYRARLVAKGFTQRHGVDYVDTFSPVVKHSTLRMLFALSVQWGIDVTHLDVTTAFLNGHLKEDIYMCIPEGFQHADADGKVVKLKRAIYGLKQSSLVWYERVRDYLCKLGFKNSKLEPCLFTKYTEDVKIIITLYVDDFLIFSNCAVETEKLKAALGSEFKLKDLGPVRRYLGMRINVDKNCNTITVDQQQYIEQLLSRFEMSDCRAIDTPIECKLNIKRAMFVRQVYHIKS